MAGVSILFAAVWLLSLAGKKDEAWLSPGDTLALRGFFALFILFVHLPDACRYLVPSYAETFEPFIFQGHLAVGVFFALSGYGLARSARRGLAGFFSRRFLGVLLPYLIANLIYYAVFRVQGEPVTLTAMLRSCLTGAPLVTYSWYIVTQLMFYVLFYIAFRFFAERKMKTAVLLLLVTAYMLAMPRPGWPLVTTRGCLAFPFGAFLGLYRDEAERFIGRAGGKRLTAVFGTAFLLTHSLYFAVPFFKEHPLFDFSSVFFAAFVFLGSRFIVLKPPLFHALGRVSLELYLGQGLAFAVLRRVFQLAGVLNIFLYAFFSLLLAVSGAFAAHFLYEQMKKLVNNSIFDRKTA